MTNTLANIENAKGLSPEHREALEALLDVFSKNEARNRDLVRYYEGDVDPAPIGIDTVPEGARVSMRLDWPRKAVTSVSERTRLDCFVFDGGEDASFSRIAAANGLVNAYNRHVESELTHGCMFATVNATEGGAPAVRFHTAQSAAGIWDVANARLGSGFAVADARRTAWSPRSAVPVQVNLHLPEEIVVLRQASSCQWEAEALGHPMGRPLMESFSFRPTGAKPFGSSRISKTVMDLSDEVMRTLQDMAVSSAMYASPSRYLLGLTDEQYDAIAKNKWATAIGALILATRDEDGNVPSVGQLPAVSPQPYVEMLRAYAALFSGATGVPLNSLGIVQDNPSSAEAIASAREDICIAAQDLIESNRESLRNVALMAMAVDAGTDVDGLSDAQRSVMACFRDPTMPSMVTQSDAVIKLASADPSFAGTDVFYEKVGFDEATRRRVKAEKERAAAKAAVTALMAGGANGADTAQ